MPLVIYTPAGQMDFMKPGGSLKPSVNREFEKFSALDKYNVLVKVKYNKTVQDSIKQILKKTNIHRRKIIDDGSTWNLIFNQIVNNIE